MISTPKTKPMHIHDKAMAQQTLRKHGYYELCTRKLSKNFRRGARPTVDQPQLIEELTEETKLTRCHFQIILVQTE